MDPLWWETHIEKTAKHLARTRKLAISVLEKTRGHPFTRLAVGGQSNQEHDDALAALFDRIMSACVRVRGSDQNCAGALSEQDN